MKNEQLWGSLWTIFRGKDIEKTNKNVLRSSTLGIDDWKCAEFDGVDINSKNVRGTL